MITPEYLYSTVLGPSEGLAACPVLLVVMVQGLVWPFMSSAMGLVASWKQNGSHSHSHPFTDTRRNPPEPKGTARNTSFVFGAVSWGLPVKRHK